MKIELKVGAITDLSLWEAARRKFAVVDSGEKASLISEEGSRATFPGRP